jgi:hypothetical protein
MRTIPRAAAVLTAALVLGGPCRTALAEDIYYLNQSQTGFDLPGVTLPQGQDEVRAADGTTCRSAVSGSGAYLDVGVIKGSGTQSDDYATYGRIVIPLSRSPARLDCARLYELEVQRLQLELKLLKMGLAPGVSHETTGSTAASWASEGWSDGNAAEAAPSARIVPTKARPKSGSQRAK